MCLKSFQGQTHLSKRILSKDWIHDSRCLVYSIWTSVCVLVIYIVNEWNGTNNNNCIQNKNCKQLWRACFSHLKRIRAYSHCMLLHINLQCCDGVTGLTDDDTWILRCFYAPILFFFWATNCFLCFIVLQKFCKQTAK